MWLIKLQCLVEHGEDALAILDAHLWCSGSHTWDMTIRAMPSSIFWVEISCVELPSPLSTLLSPTSMMPTCTELDAEECRRVCRALH